MMVPQQQGTRMVLMACTGVDVAVIFKLWSLGFSGKSFLRLQVRAMKMDDGTSVVVASGLGALLPS